MTLEFDQVHAASALCPDNRGPLGYRNQRICPPSECRGPAAEGWGVGFSASLARYCAKPFLAWARHHQYRLQESC
ncbi:hypothetical protein PoB_004363700 [Plakobranchus ocellatus]|uniref:Uncharacterized protein n=1 Tax=Plakobranchus ocellatus TaxID=259542 RepID=A0AAV4BDV7_9GAST|nr:hypothetical protein PoB_004363700 [Plakobranchus ocellatus]